MSQSEAKRACKQPLGMVSRGVAVGAGERRGGFVQQKAFCFSAETHRSSCLTDLCFGGIADANRHNFWLPNAASSSNCKSRKKMVRAFEHLCVGGGGGVVMWGRMG